MSGPEATSISTDAFSNLTTLKSIATFATVIEVNSLNGANKLESIDLKRPNGSVVLKSAPYPDSLNSIIIRSNEMAVLYQANLPYSFLVGKSAVYVPSELVATYKSNWTWNDRAAGHIFSIDDYPITNWDTIKDSDDVFFEKLANGSAVTEYNIGDTKTISVGSEGDVMFSVAAKNADELADGTGTAGLTFVCRTPLRTKHRINPLYSGSDYPDSGRQWEHCEMREYLNETIWPLLPEALKASIKKVKKYTSWVNSNNVAVNDSITEDKIWLLSARETNDVNPPFKETLGPVYDALYTKSVYRIVIPDDSTSAVQWWLRTGGTMQNWTAIGTDGSASMYGPYSSYHVVFGFCV